MADVSYCRVLPTYWTDPKVRKGLVRDQRHLLLYFFTSPHTNMLGLYYLPLEYAEKEADLPRDDIESWIRGDLSPFVTYDWTTEEILVHRAARHQVGEVLSDRDKRLKAAERILRDAHSLELVALFLRLNPGWPIGQDIQDRVRPSPFEGPSKPLRSPFEASAAASTAATTATAAAAADGAPSKPAPPNSSAAPSADEPPPPTPSPPSDRLDQDETADGIIAAANHAMRRHPGLDRIRDIKTSHSSREDVVAWLQEDIPVDLIVETIQRSVGSFRPAGRDRQINSMRYFDDAIREAWQARRAKPLLGSEAASIRNEKPGGDRRGSADLARLNAEAEARTRQTEDIQAWVTEHPAEWSRVKTSIEEELKRDDFWKGMPDLLITKTVEARCREAIAQRMAKEANAA